MTSLAAKLLCGSVCHTSMWLARSCNATKLKVSRTSSQLLRSFCCCWATPRISREADCELLFVAVGQFRDVALFTELSMSDPFFDRPSDCRAWSAFSEIIQTVVLSVQQLYFLQSLEVPAMLHILAHSKQANFYLGRGSACSANVSCEVLFTWLEFKVDCGAWSAFSGIIRAVVPSAQQLYFPQSLEVHPCHAPHSSSTF